MYGIKEVDITEPKCRISFPQLDVLTDELMGDWDRCKTKITTTCLCVCGVCDS